MMQSWDTQADQVIDSARSLRRAMSVSMSCKLVGMQHTSTVLFNRVSAQHEEQCLSVVSVFVTITAVSVYH